MDNNSESISADIFDASPSSQTSESRSEYAWAKCKTAGWHVLVNTSSSASPPEPPKCLSISCKKAPPSGRQSPRSNTVQPPWDDTDVSPRSGSRSPKAKDAFSPNFVQANIRNASPQSRVTKAALLEQASNQLHESEVIGTSLAERLRLLQKKIVQ